jgi:dolichol-phosphate mannosyltransferase
MDADLQHDEALLPVMLERLRSSDLDIVVGSRYVAGGSTHDWSDDRKALSRVATALSRVVLHADLADPMSGYFMIRREPMYASVRRLTGLGYKILLDLFASSPTPLRYAELPLGFRPRTRGESKLDATVGWEYALMLVDKLIGHVVPVRFVAFTLVGSVGVLVHLSVLTAAMGLLRITFVASHALATFAAMSFNFALNNALTYRDRRLKGWQLLTGWISFTLACGIGALANVGVAGYLFNQRTYWLWSALAGVLVGAVWNYAVTAVYTWNKRD